jgi:serine/threonine protein kinase
MSPEQMRSTRTIDARADIWALGVILQELITGSAPFDGATMPDLLAAILQDRPVPLSWLRPDAPPELEAVIARCLEKEPSARYADVAELTQALASFGSTSARVSADRVSRVIRPHAAGSMSTAPPPRSTRPSAAEFRPEPPSSGATVTVDATANAWGATGGAPQTAARAVGLAVGSLFFASVLILAIFGTQAKRSSPYAPAAASGGPAGAPESPFVPATLWVGPDDTPTLRVEQGETAASSPAAQASALAPSPAKAPPVAPPRRRAPPASLAPLPSTTSADERDLFDGPK